MAPDTPNAHLNPTDTFGNPPPAPLQMLFNRLQRGRNKTQSGAFGGRRKDTRQSIPPNGFARPGPDTRAQD